MTRVLVPGDERHRGDVASRLEATLDAGVDDCDPVLADCVMFVRLEGVRYDAFVSVGYGDSVTRGALAPVADRAVLVALLDPGAPDPHRSMTGTSSGYRAHSASGMTTSAAASTSAFRRPRQPRARWSRKH